MTFSELPSIGLCMYYTKMRCSLTFYPSFLFCKKFLFKALEVPSVCSNQNYAKCIFPMGIQILALKTHLIGLYYTLDDITNPNYKLLHFLTTIFCKEKKALAFNRDRCYHLALCLWSILFQ